MKRPAAKSKAKDSDTKKENDAERLEKEPNEGGATPGGDETPKEKELEAEQPDLRNLSASQLLNHNKILEEVEKLKNGTITEGEFLGGLQQSQKQGFFHMMEKRRSDAENESWKQMVGPGSKKIKHTAASISEAGWLDTEPSRTKSQFCTGVEYHQRCGMGELEKGV